MRNSSGGLDAGGLDTGKQLLRRFVIWVLGDELAAKVIPPAISGPADIMVLDDTGNRFRRSREQWPEAVVQPDKKLATLVIRKLHRPLPDSNNASALWQVLSGNFHHKIVIVSADDLRAADANISCGLSWERTALDLVWQLLIGAQFEALRNCPHLIVRLGLDGAVY